MPRFGGMIEEIPPLDENKKIDSERVTDTSRGDPLKMEAYEFLRADMDAYKILSKEEFTEVWREWKATGDRKLMEKMMGSNMPLVLRRADFYYNRVKNMGHIVSRDDLIQEGLGGLFHAIPRYNPDKFGTKVTTYVDWHIKQRMRRFIQDHRNTIRIPTHALENMMKEDKIIDKLTKELDRDPTEEEILVALGGKRLSGTESARGVGIASLDHGVVGQYGESIPRHEMVEDRRIRPTDEIIISREDAELYEMFMADFTPVERVFLRFSKLADVFGNDELSAPKRAERALIEGVLDRVPSRERVRQITDRAWKKFLRKKILYDAGRL